MWQGQTAHITQAQFADLCECYARLTPGDEWVLPEWLVQWGVRLGYLTEPFDIL